MQPKYEEKTFESYFNGELDRKSSIYFPFGQVQEGGMGADAAGYSRSRSLWRRLGYGALRDTDFRGVKLHRVAAEMERHLGREIRNIPKIKVNLLFQYKRPELITTSLGSEWNHWGRSYFRYDIYREQQQLLTHLESKFGSRALVLYAAPAIEDINDLVRLKKKNKIIDNTNFRRASELANHHRNTYTKAGTYSIACSDPEHMGRFDLLAKLEQLESIKEADTTEIIVDFAARIRGIAAEDQTLGFSYATALSEYSEAGFEQFSVLYSCLSLLVLREVTGLQWLVATDRE